MAPLTPVGRLSHAPTSAALVPIAVCSVSKVTEGGEEKHSGQVTTTENQPGKKRERERGEMAVTRHMSRQAACLVGVQPDNSITTVPISAEEGNKNLEDLLAQAKASIEPVRVRGTTKAQYASGLPWKFPVFIEYISGNGMESGTEPPPSVWGLQGVSREQLVLTLVAFQSYLNEEGLTKAQVTNQWSKTYDSFATPDPNINSSVITSEVWEHDWVSAARKITNLPHDLHNAIDGLDRRAKRQLAGGVAILWEIRKKHFMREGWAGHQHQPANSFGYIAILLMFNFGWRPGQLVWTTTTAHMLRRGHVIFTLHEGDVAFPVA